MLKKAAIFAIFAGLFSNHAMAQQANVQTERLPSVMEAYMNGIRKDKSPVYEGNNILRIAPLAIMHTGPGFGISYERLVGADKKVGIVLPVTMTFESQNYGMNDVGTNNFFYFTPGVKVYVSNPRRVTFAIGPNLMFGHGSGSRWDWNGGFSQKVDYTRTLVGILVNNYIGFNVTKSLTLGIEGGPGVVYSDKESTTVLGSATTINNGINATGNIQFNLGFRF